ncbi:co-chaperone DjlA [Candidatus Riesia pediculicola]|uniref:DnaJ domain protein n=1 Tax=Riesia pediculicola (strain USDA) TaxID=515618 RepID=D4G8G1_RIEPU|nr:co-chaperone DjlA [Candidatus Riesia pediculicola]ADD79760.1 DnaJ domain protein [Candidatus Riesia pediculicola USDA]ARC53845.1 hypothetical protein AOE55_01640 [Candidatus Riesia pediculicola]ARC54546.1 hypothetical protein AOE56_01880 [Candidatus Riesia pediculicola]QOJ86477.1 co-chaperone DjlA [Candidatus Riesia pediculicola]
MQYFGRIIGVILGMMMGTHLFSIIMGFIIGHMYDKKVEEKYSDIKHKNTDLSFIVIVFQVLGYLSKSKGRVTETDIKMARNIIDEMHLCHRYENFAKNAFLYGKRNDFLLRKALRNLYYNFSNNPELIRYFLEIQIRAAFSDHILQEKEKNILLIIINELNISYQDFEWILKKESIRSGFYNQYFNFFQNKHDQKKDDLSQAYNILGIDRRSSMDQVKKSYRILMKKYHPDKLLSKGLSKEELSRANKKAQKIQSAYNLIKNSRK